MYVDEVGNHDLRPATVEDPNQRYLSLTGIIISLQHVANELQPRLEELKRDFFSSHPDAPLVLHRKELVNRRRPFEALRDPATEERFNHELLRLIAETRFSAITVVIDKATHLQRYGAWAAHPYHYCMVVLVERYVHELRGLGARGDVMAEARGGREDIKLKEVYENIYDRGTENIPAPTIQARLTSRQLKLANKRDNIAGLQLADMIAHPSWKGCVAAHHGEPVAANFGGQIVEILRTAKYRRWGGKIEGAGTKWLP